MTAGLLVHEDIGNSFKKIKYYKNEKNYCKERGETYFPMVLKKY
jgi:hypothetical protein